jgi:hypothetical protein
LNAAAVAAASSQAERKSPRDLTKLSRDSSKSNVPVIEPKKSPVSAARGEAVTLVSPRVEPGSRKVITLTFSLSPTSLNFSLLSLGPSYNFEEASCC